MIILALLKHQGIVMAHTHVLINKNDTVKLQNVIQKEHTFRKVYYLLYLLRTHQ